VIKLNHNPPVIIISWQLRSYFSISRMKPNDLIQLSQNLYYLFHLNFVLLLIDHILTITSYTWIPNAFHLHLTPDVIMISIKICWTKAECHKKCWSAKCILHHGLGRIDPRSRTKHLIEWHLNRNQQSCH
jgi:hypothetical protein